jgi:DNA-directed RNA polymerase subunit L
MAGFEGTWIIQEHKVWNGPIIVDEGASEEINIDKTKDGSYTVHIPLRNGNPLDVELTHENDRTLSYKGYHDDDHHYYVRLLFDSDTNPQAIIEEAGGSVIERWRTPAAQPDDMGTITGTKG